MPERDPPMIATAVATVYSSPWWTVEEHDTVDRDGKHEMFNVLSCGDGVSVLAMTEGDYWLIREYKYAIGRYIWQLPSGSIDVGEEPIQAGTRELLEETGLVADNWTTVGRIYPYPTNVASAVHLFLAHDARLTGTPEPGVEALSMSRSEVKRLIVGNEIVHAASLVCLLTQLAGETPAGRHQDG